MKDQDSIQLTQREREILQLIAGENNSRQIAQILTISIRTVETHRKNLMNKLRVNNVAGLTKKAIQLGLLPNYTFQN